jgi:hypothetical protein
MRRTDQERARLFDLVVARVIAEPVWADPSPLQVRFDGPDMTPTVIEPPRPPLRSLLMEVRKLDSPGDDCYLPDIMEIVEASATDPEWKAGLAAARRRYHEWQSATGQKIVITDSDGPISPREAFELWVYGEHLHDDAEKARRMERLDEQVRPFVGHIAIAYMEVLARIAAWVQSAMHDDPGARAALAPDQ